MFVWWVRTRGNQERWIDSQRGALAQTPAMPAPRRGERRSSESIPPSPPILKKGPARPLFQCLYGGFEPEEIKKGGSTANAERRRRRRLCRRPEGVSGKQRINPSLSANYAKAPRGSSPKALTCPRLRFLSMRASRPATDAFACEDSYTASTCRAVCCARMSKSASLWRIGTSPRMATAAIRQSMSLRTVCPRWRQVR